MTEKNVEQSAWNLSQQIINQIGFLLQSASIKFRNGDFQNSYWDTEEVRTLIYNDLSEEENKKLSEWEIKICKYHSVASSLARIHERDRLPLEQYKRMKSEEHMHYAEVKKYRMYIMKLLGKYGYLVQKKEDSSKMF